MNQHTANVLALVAFALVAVLAVAVLLGLLHGGA